VKRPPPKRPRARRTPEEARELILRTAKKLLSERGPDAVGLKEVARDAGVSHALVSHYFGTYGALVEAVMSSHQQTMRAELFARMAASPEEGPAAWIEHCFAAIAHPRYGKLAAWAVLSGRLDREGFFARREQGLKMVVDVLEQRLAGAVPRERLERLALLVLTSALGYSMGRTAMWAALGKEATSARDAQFRAELGALIEPLVAEAKKRRR
jgi:AcrR family transcriptional regulator